MKKILSVILAVAMIFALCTAAFAAESTEWIIDAISEDETVEGVTLTLTPEEEWVEDEVVAELIANMSEEDAKLFEEAGVDVSKVTAIVALQKKVELTENEPVTIQVIVNTEVVTEDFNVAVYFIAEDAAEDAEPELLAVGIPPLDVEIVENGEIVVVILQ